MTRRTRNLVVVLIVALILGTPIGTYAAYRRVIVERRAQALSHHRFSKEYATLAASLDINVIMANKSILPSGSPDSQFSFWEGPTTIFDPRLGYVLSWRCPSVGKTPEELHGIRRSEIEELFRERVSYHELMEAKWSSAVWSPWSKVNPDGLIPPITYGGTADSTF